MYLFASKMSSTAEYEMLRMEEDPLIAPDCRPEDQAKQIGSDKNKASTQEWANGIRGLAAFSVMNHHLVACFNEQAVTRACDMDGTVHIWQWPIIRVVVSPLFMVTTFFILSGYVLSYGPLERLAKDPMSAISVRNSLASACFRRIFRLFPPAAMSILISHIILLCGGFNAYKNGTNWEWWIKEGTPRWVTTNWHAQTLEALKDVVTIWYTPSTTSHYNVVLWTMPLELQGSLSLYVVLLATSNLRRQFRVIIGIGIVIIALVTKDDLTGKFVIGLLIAESRLVELKPLKSKKIIQAWDRIQTPFKSIMLIIAFFLGSIPPGMDNRTYPVPWPQYMYDFLFKLYGRNLGEVVALYTLISVTLMILTVSHWPASQKILSVRPLRYLGKISFSLYVLHAPLLLSLGVGLVVKFRQLGISDNLSIFLMVPFWYGAVFGCSHLMTNYIDKKAIQFSHQLEKRWSINKSTSGGDEILHQIDRTNPNSNSIELMDEIHHSSSRNLTQLESIDVQR
ncbi:hypothetical protein CROQUDRAFT_62673 [Cronartium quercuum f. sp. fusiforme G11]|uniref:Acyltransferase 3 domain-containing protein n=1 Tax=Cronartium quercuum f. sp. fusiforme G11 TaxID=708437 RepID=A0A9P6TBR1_9BASI|nr:hypothetical protein CROQUDRAFT_62673 [Cronartium quercuum f. sp. fusiforme G11]